MKHAALGWIFLALFHTAAAAQGERVERVTFPTNVVPNTLGGKPVSLCNPASPLGQAALFSRRDHAIERR